MANSFEAHADAAVTHDVRDGEHTPELMRRANGNRSTGLNQDAIPTRTRTSTSTTDPEGHEDSDADADDVSSIFEQDYHPSSSHAHRRPHTSSTSTSYSTTESHTVLRKLDRNLTLFLSLLYLLSFLDRSNIGNARVAGLQSSLGISSAQFDLTLLAFYATYITFEWMILLYRRVPAHIYIAICVFSWGLVACCQALVTRFEQLLVLRAVLGVTEAAFGPGVPFYMTFFYRREELAYRVGLQISAAPLATGFASSLAWVVLKVGENVPVEGWRLLFLIEGFPSIVVAVVAWWTIPDGPGSARWLTPRERRVAVLRVQGDVASGSGMTGEKVAAGAASRREKLALSSVRATLLDLKAWLNALMFFSVNISFASLPVFLPTIINDMSFSALTSQILAAPPYLFAFAFVLLISRASDRIPNSRGYFLTACAGLSSLSYAIIAITGMMAASGRISSTGNVSVFTRYIAVYGAAMGLFTSVVLIITWQLNNQASVHARGIAMVILNVVGQTGPLVGVKLFPGGDAPYFVKGIVVCSAAMGAVALLSAGLRVYLGRLNRKGVDVAERGRYEMVGMRGGRGDDGDDGDGDVHGVEGVDFVDEGGGRKEFRYML